VVRGGSTGTDAGSPAHTDRERQTTVLAAEGLANDEIAERLKISVSTARTHISRAMIKLGARDRAQLVMFAYPSSLVD
jgi:DNA-binding CsgD family transcriptional regulator